MRIQAINTLEFLLWKRILILEIYSTALSNRIQEKTDRGHKKEQTHFERKTKKEKRGERGINPLYMVKLATST